MSLELVRIDDRLIHGQVVEAWIPHLKADAVVVASAAAAADATQQTLMQMALPENVDLHVAAPAEAAALLLSPRLADKRVLALVPSPREARELLEAGVPIAALNVGGLHYSAGRIQLGRVIYLSDDDRKDLRELAQRGVILEGRAVPSDRRLDLTSLIA